MGNTSYFNNSDITNAGRIKDTFVPLGDISGSDQKTILITRPTMPDGCEAEIEKFSFATETSITANDTNYWSFQVANLTDTKDLLSAAQTTKATGGSGITADTVWEITPDQNTTLGAGKILELQVTKAASATTMAECSITVHWRYKGRFEDD